MAKKIRVFIDVENLVLDHFSGIGHYTLELLKALDKQAENRDDLEVNLIVYFRRIDKLRSLGFKNFRIRRSPFPLRITNGLKIRGLQPYYDLFFGKGFYLFPNYTSWPLLFSKGIPIVYDLSFEHFPQYVEPRNQKFLSSQVRNAVERSDRVITISKNSQKEICEFYNVEENKVHVLYPAVDQSKFFRWPKAEIDKIKAKYGVHGEYILFVGNIEPRKNLKNLLLAYEKLDPDTRKKYSLLLVGSRGWLDDEIFEIIERLRIAGNHIQQPLGYVKDKDRPALFSGASVFVYPSKYEGFGIPPLEAMACGVPVITSDNSSLPEAVGEAAIKVKSESIDEIKSAINKLIENPKLAEDLTEKGFDQVDKFSWDHEASKLIKILENIS